MSTRTLPPLEVGQTYTVADFETYEYRHQILTGSKCILSLHLKNGTILDVPSDEEHLKTLSVCCVRHSLQLPSKLFKV